MVDKYVEIMEFAMFITQECRLKMEGTARQYFAAYKSLFLSSDEDFSIIALNTMKGIETLKDEYIRGN